VNYLHLIDFDFTCTSQWRLDSWLWGAVAEMRTYLARRFLHAATSEDLKYDFEMTDLYVI